MKRTNKIHRIRKSMFWIVLFSFIILVYTILNTFESLSLYLLGLASIIYFMLISPMYFSSSLYYTITGGGSEASSFLWMGIGFGLYLFLLVTICLMIKSKKNIASFCFIGGLLGFLIWPLTMSIILRYSVTDSLGHPTLNVILAAATFSILIGSILGGLYYKLFKND